MHVKDVGEFELIEMLIETIDRGHGDAGRGKELGYRLRVPAGDDAAVWDGRGGIEVMTTDVMVEGVHFDLELIGWKDLGWKCVAVNLSDVAAMGCAPLYGVVGLGLRDDLPVGGLVEMYEGMLDVCREYGVTLVGGDIVRCPVFFVSIAMMGAGQAPDSGRDASQPLLLRSAAKAGDAIAVTGNVGCAGGGLRMMRQELSFDEETSLHLRLAHNRPVARISEGMVLAGQGVRAAIDVSDGLVDDLRKLCASSGVGAVVHSDDVPADRFLRRAYPDQWLPLALTAGEDYELLFTAPPETMDRVVGLLDTPVSVIGETVEEGAGVTVVDKLGNRVGVEGGGWDHFRQG